MSTKILVVDDEQDLVRLVRYNLEQEGFDVYCAYDGNSAIELAWQKRPDMVILDLMLPDKPGIEVCRQIKQDIGPEKNIPVLMLTARATEQDRINGFESGADDYVTKPFSPRELVLRVKAMLGRPWLKSTSEERTIGLIHIIPHEYRVQVDGEDVRLTPIEYKILTTLARTPNVVKTREQLLQDVWEEEAMEILDRTVDAHMKRLRAKLGDARGQLETIRGIGYRLTAEAPAPTTSPTASTATPSA